jgi:hypothetical protein
MSRQYDDSRFGVEMILTFPGHCDNITAAGNVSQIPFSQDVTLVEFGIVVTEAFSAGFATQPTMELREGSVVLATISIPSASAIGTVLTTTTLTANTIDKADTLIFYRSITALTSGECDGYVKIRERFKGG